MGKINIFEMKYSHGSDKYKYVDVYVNKNTGDIGYLAKLRKIKQVKGNGKFFNTEVDAAKTVDLWLIKHGKEPVNILKRK